MRDAIGGGLLLNWVVIFVAVIIILFTSTLTYSKAYKVKNRIIEIVEKYEGYTDEAIAEIEADLKTIGYSISIRSNCSSDNLNTSTYKYCIYESNNTLNSETKYYKIVTYVHFDFPIIGDAINIPVKGETKILGNRYTY